MLSSAAIVFMIWLPMASHILLFCTLCFLFKFTCLYDIPTLINMHMYMLFAALVAAQLTASCISHIRRAKYNYNCSGLSPAHYSKVVMIATPTLLNSLI